MEFYDFRMEMYSEIDTISNQVARIQKPGKNNYFYIQSRKEMCVKAEADVETFNSMTIQEEKQALRAQVAELKKSYTPETLQALSADVLLHAEQNEAFRQATCIALYHAIPGEVQTAAFIEKWYRKKEIALPIVTNNDLKLVLYRGKEALRQGAFGIWEPDSCCPEIDEKAVECILVPGIAFDRTHNRMGRGKGYYDRLLQTVSAPKIGLAFRFQLFDRIPVDSFDRKMDFIATDRELF